MKSISVSSRYAPLRVCADICFYLYVVAVLSLSEVYKASYEGVVVGIVSNYVAPWELQLVVFVFACLAAGFVAVRTDSRALRFVLSLIPGLSFLMSRPEPAMLFHAAAWVYYIFFITIGDFEVFIDRYRRRVRLMLITALVVSGLLVVFHFANDRWYSTRFFGGELFGLLFFIFAVVSLRGIRLVNGAPKSMRVIDAVYVAALPAVLTASIFLFRAMVPVVTGLIKLFMSFLRWLYGLFSKGAQTPEVLNIIEEIAEEADEGPVDLNPKTDKEPFSGPIGGKDPGIHITDNMYMIITAVVLIAILVFILVKMLKNKKNISIIPVEKTENIERIPPERTLRRRPAATSSNARKIRGIYRSYLEHFKSLGMKIVSSDASQDILEHSLEYSKSPENSALRGLYIAARYGDPSSVTAEQTAEAKRLLVSIKERSSDAGA